MSSPLVVPAIPRFSKAVNYVAAQLRILRKEKKKHEIEEKKKKEDDYEKIMTCETSLNTLRNEYCTMKALHAQNLEKKLQEASNAIYQKLDEIRTTTLTMVYDAANDIEANIRNEYGSLKGIENRLMKDQLKFRTKMTEEIAFVERQAETNDTNMITLKDAVNSVLERLTGGQISIDLAVDNDNDSDTDTDDEG